jgi:hypothetical protein
LRTTGTLGIERLLPDDGIADALGAEVAPFGLRGGHFQSEGQEPDHRTSGSETI